jgi:serine/threonine protein kinase
VDGQLLAVKVLEKSRSELDNPHLIEVFTEVSILEVCIGDRRVSQLIDYGCTSESYYIVMEFYPATLKGWRKKCEDPPQNMLLRVYREFLNCCTVLRERRINHFDIKCDNVMLDRHGFPALADFGEAMSYKNETNCYTMLNKGTEWIKSPEMLSIAPNSAVTNPTFDRRRKVGAGPASDIWSIGCLFYELVTGEFLFVDADWSRFFLRVTTPHTPILTEENRQALKCEKYCTFLEFVLQKSVGRRPILREVIVKFDEMFPDAREGELPVLKMPDYPRVM